MIKGIGVDIVGINRFKEIKDNHDFINQILCEKEIFEISTSKQKEIHLAINFAIKEALMKAFGCGLSYGTYWHDIIVEKNWHINIKGFFKKIADEKAIKKIHCSYSLSKNYIIALIILEG